MTRLEFMKIAAYVGIAVRKPLSAEALEVYFDLLSDLPAETLQIAVKRVLLEHRWPNFPTVAEMRQAAAEVSRGQINELSAGEAWRVAWEVAKNTDPEVEGSFERALKKYKASPLVREAIATFGLMDLCYGKEPVGVIRGQFLKVFEQLQARDKRIAVLPDRVKQAIAGIGGVMKPVTQAIEG